jgi:adenylate cyclase
MNTTTVDKILQERELKNERSLAVVRFTIFIVITIADCLAYFNIIPFTADPPTQLTLILDLTFVVFSSIVLFILIRGLNFAWLKFAVLSIDYLLISIIIIVDPTVPKDSEIINWVVLVALLFIFMLNLLRHSIGAVVYASVLTLSLFWFMNYYISGSITSVMLPMSISLSFLLFIGFSVTRSNRKMMIEANTKKMMERYLPPQLVGELYKQSATLEPGGDETEATILFSDIRSFTSLSETLAAKDVVLFLNDYLSTMTKIIFKNRGTLDKFIGDAIMTIFGAPHKLDDDAIRAVNTAVEMQEEMKKFNKKYTNLKEPLKIGIGIHTGVVIAGNIGSEERLDYTVIGDNVNLASRIESLTKHYGSSILISDECYMKIKESSYRDEYIIREIDTVIVKGKKRSISVYEVMGRSSDEINRELHLIKENYETALAHYRKQEFGHAVAKLKENENDKTSKVLASRCRYYLQNPPGNDWDGIFTMKNK